MSYYYLNLNKFSNLLKSLLNYLLMIVVKLVSMYLDS